MGKKVSFSSTCMETNSLSFESKCLMSSQTSYIASILKSSLFALNLCELVFSAGRFCEPAQDIRCPYIPVCVFRWSVQPSTGKPENPPS